MGDTNKNRITIYYIKDTPSVFYPDAVKLNPNFKLNQLDRVFTEYDRSIFGPPEGYDEFKFYSYDEKIKDLVWISLFGSEVGKKWIPINNFLIPLKLVYERT